MSWRTIRPSTTGSAASWRTARSGSRAAAVGDKSRRIHNEVGGFGEVTEEDTTPNERSAILALAGNYLKRTSLKEFAAQARGGVGRRAAPLAVEHLATCRDHDTLLCITDAGVAYGAVWKSTSASDRRQRGGDD